MTPPATAGLDTAAVGAWLAARVPGVRLPLVGELITGGHSNLTYRLTDQDGRRWVLRRPPLHGVLPTAHDMAREHMILSALAGTAVPVPPVVGLCEDDAVTGAPFYVTEHLTGLVLRAVGDAAGLPEPTRARLGERLVDTLAALHDLDPEAVGLGAMVRRTPYLQRQLRRWQEQWQRSRTRELPLADDVHRRLVAQQPQQSDEQRIVHGDYRLDNLMVDHAGRIVAVFDWELCAVGDPLTDLGVLLAYWTEQGEEPIPFLPPTTALPGFPDRRTLVDRYRQRTGRPVDGIGYYHAFACWKVGVIAEGVAARYAAGAMDGRVEQAQVFLAAADGLFRRADALLRDAPGPA